jgi:tetratricopeptide (TPR) repeat protein
MKDNQLLDLFRWSGTCQRRLGNPRQAITMLMNALNLQVTIDEYTSIIIRYIKIEIGWSWHNLENYDQAMIWYRKALEPNEIEETRAKMYDTELHASKGTRSTTRKNWMSAWNRYAYRCLVCKTCLISLEFVGKVMY